MRDFIKTFKHWILLWIMVLIFLTTWPLILIGLWIRAIFSDKISDMDKIKTTKEMIIGAALLTMFGGAYLFSDKIISKLSPVTNSVGGWISHHWHMFILLFVVLVIWDYQKVRLLYFILGGTRCGTPTIQMREAELNRLNELKNPGQEVERKFRKLVRKD